MTAVPDPQPAPVPVDLREEIRRATASLHQAPPPSGPAMTSDLSIDEELILHAVGWEPVELVTGVSLCSIPAGVWNWGQGEIVPVSNAFTAAVDLASRRLHREAAEAGGHGVVGVRVTNAVHRHHVDVALVGTAVRPVGARAIDAGAVFISDLSAKDFALLHQAGWAPLGLAAGASFVYAQWRSMGTALRQTGQNVELTNLTQAMYAAREAAMERMQASAIAMGGSGVVAVSVSEGPTGMGSHAVGFTAWGTVVKLAAEAHRALAPVVVVPLDDRVVTFEATSLRGD